MTSSSGCGSVKSSRTKGAPPGAPFVREERRELPGCDLHFVDPHGVVLLVVIAVELDSGIQRRCPHGVNIEAAIDVALVTVERDRDNLSVDAGGVHGICDVIVRVDLHCNDGIVATCGSDEMNE